MNTSKIIGLGHVIPTQTIKNKYFDQHVFMTDKGIVLTDTNATIQDKLRQITGIVERKYVADHQVTSDIGLLAAQEAINDAAIDPNTLDYIIFAHNFGDVQFGTTQMDSVPSLAARVKHSLGISNNFCVAYDILFGCPGWNEGLIQANTFIKAGLAKRCLVIGAETLSRVVDVHDRDSMIYSDGAGAVVIEKSEEGIGIQHHLTASYTLTEKDYLFFGTANGDENNLGTKYIKMQGKKIYAFALNEVPKCMKKCLDDSGYGIEDVHKIIIHQANEKMDEEIVNRFYALYQKPVPVDIMPMIIAEMGNSSVATIPTLLSMIQKGALLNHHLSPGSIILLASVGAGMNVNCIVYKC